MQIIGLISFSLLLGFTPLTYGFKCYVCDSKEDNECVENLPKNSRLQPKECHDIIDAKYCVKTTNMYAGKIHFLLYFFH